MAVAVQDPFPAARSTLAALLKKVAVGQSPSRLA